MKAFAPRSKPTHLPASRRSLVVRASTGLYNFPATLRTGEECHLAIGPFGFSYNALGGEVLGTARMRHPEDPVLEIKFEKMNIPTLDFRTGGIKMPSGPRLFGIPPICQVDIVPLELSGTLDTESGRINLDFVSDFYFTVGNALINNGEPIYKGKPIHVRTRLTSESIIPPGPTVFQYTKTQGTRWSAEDGKVLMVGKAPIAMTGDLFLDNVLLLPGTCWAEMSAQLTLGAPASQDAQAASQVTVSVAPSQAQPQYTPVNGMANGTTVRTVSRN